MALPSARDFAHTSKLTLRQPADEEITTYLATLRAYQARVRYPALLQLWNQDQGILYRQAHQDAGLITIAVEQRALSEAACWAIGEFRLHQFLLCRWYDAARALDDQAQTDPQMARIPATSLHLLTLTPEGQILAYCTLQAPTHEGSVTPLATLTGQYVQDWPRALFPAERELFGPALFATLPALRTIPLEALGDFTCLLQNQALRSPLRTIAVIDAILSMIGLLTRPGARWQAILGNMDREARALLASLGVPVLYAPQAPVAVDALPYLHYWAAEEIGPPAQGKYWPFVVAIDDLRAERARFEQAHQAFAGAPGALRRALVAWRARPSPVAPTAFVPAAGTRAAALWRADAV